MRGKYCNPLGNSSILHQAKVLLPPPPLPHTHIPDQSPAQLEPDFRDLIVNFNQFSYRSTREILEIQNSYHWLLWLGPLAKKFKTSNCLGKAIHLLGQLIAREPVHWGQPSCTDRYSLLNDKGTQLSNVVVSGQLFAM